jgi:O-antigen/teichoic acid export membrane protein
MPSNILRKFLDLWRDGESAGRRAVRGSVLVFTGRGIGKLLQFVQTVIIARLLFPQDIGLFGLATLSLSLTEVLFQTGFNMAIVQEKGDVYKHLDGVWTMNVIRGLFLAGLAYWIAPTAGVFFHNGGLVPIVRVLALLFLISGFQNVGNVLLQRELRFNRLFFYDVIGTASQVLVVIVVAYLTRSVWALVAGALALRIAFLITSYIIHPYRPRFTVDLSGARHLFKFGKWIGATSVITFFVSQGDSLAVGHLLNTSDLAYYNMAFALGTLVAVEVASNLGGVVLLPLYSRLTDLAVLRDVFFKITRLIYGVMIPASAGLLIMGPEIIKYVYGERWLPMVPILGVVTVYGLVISFDYSVTPLLQGLGKPKTPLVGLLARAAVMFSLLVPLTRWQGAVGTAWALLAGLVVAQTILLWRVKRELRVGLAAFLGSVSVAVEASLVMAAVLWLAKFLSPVQGIASLVIFIAGGVVVYGAALYLLDQISGRKFYQAFNWIKSNI